MVTSASGATQSARVERDILITAAITVEGEEDEKKVA